MAAPPERAPARRAAPTPLADGERPPALVVAAVVCLAVGVAVAVGTATVHNLSRHGGSRPAGVLIAVFFLALAVGLLRRRYWAALAFQALLVVQLLASTLSLVLANGAVALGFSGGTLVFGGVLFYRFVPVLGRVQATSLRERGRLEQPSP